MSSKEESYMRNVGLQRKNLVAAKRAWHDQLNPELVQSLRYISEHLDLSIVSGELVLLSRSWYVTHSGLLKIATRSGCCAIHVRPVFQFCNPDLSQWTFRATVYKSLECKGFTGYGDASPSNTSQSVRGAELRIAETRAVNRALRKAYGIGLCSIEEISSSSGPLEPVAQAKKQAKPAHVGANGNGHHLRDRLLVLIRQTFPGLSSASVLLHVHS
jgi:hypothetical protein